MEYSLQDDQALFIDLYQLTMAQAYFRAGMDKTASFELTVRRFPENWGFFIMAGLEELAKSLSRFHFNNQALAYLRSLGMFDAAFLGYLGDLKLDLNLRALPEGTIFFPPEPILEVRGPLIAAQLLETLTLNISGFSIIAATLAARLVLAARGRSVFDFGMRRAQGVCSALRAARGAHIAGFAGTSDLLAARRLGMAPIGTMAHSYIQACGSEEEAFRHFIEVFGPSSVLLVDTWDSRQGIRTAARVAQHYSRERGIEIRGIRLDSGDLADLSKYARDCFDHAGVPFLRIYASNDLDEFRIAELLAAGAPIDGFGVGTRFVVSCHAPAIDIVYKLTEYDGKPTSKKSEGKVSLPGRKSVVRIEGKAEDEIVGFPARGDLLVPFDKPEEVEEIRERCRKGLAALPLEIKRIVKPAVYPVRINI